MTATRARNLLPAIAAIALAASAQAGFTNDQFEENPNVTQDGLEWPEVEFPSAETRGRGFRPGEKFVYRAQGGLFKKAGSMEIATALDPESEAEQPKLLVLTETASAGLIRRFYPMTLKAKTILDATEWRMDFNSVDGEARSEKNKSLTLLDYDRGLMKYDDEAEPRRNKVVPIPYGTALDYSSSFLQLRGFDLAVGSEFPIFICTKGKFYYVTLSVAEIETISTELGKKECFRLEPTSSFPQSKLFREGGKMSIWITNDAERIPVRFDVHTNVGNASMRIESYDNGQSTNIAQNP